MFVYKDRAVSLDNLRQVRLMGVGTGICRGILRYTDGVEVEVPEDMGRALLDFLAYRARQAEAEGYQ